MGKDKIKWATVRSKFIQMQEAHNERWNFMTGQSRPLDYGFVAVSRAGSAGNFQITRLDRETFEVRTIWRVCMRRHALYRTTIITITIIIMIIISSSSSSSSTA
jgi:hypothetical protein